MPVKRHNFPKYVRMGEVTLILDEQRDGKIKYHRPAGAWWIGAKFVGEKIVSVSEYSHMDGVHLTKTDKDTFESDNVGYV